MGKLERLLAPHPRLRAVRPGLPTSGGRCVLYWMQRAQRGVDNGALNLAIAAGNALDLPVLAAFGLTAGYPGAQRRHYRFLLDGLVDAAHDLERRGVRFVVRLGEPDASSRPWPRKPGPPWSSATRTPSGSVSDGGSGPPSGSRPLLPGGRRRRRAQLALSRGGIRRADPPAQDPPPPARIPEAHPQPGCPGAVGDASAGRRADRPGPPARGPRGRRRPRGPRLPRRHPRGHAPPEPFHPRSAAALRDRAERAHPVSDQRALGPPALRPHQPADRSPWPSREATRPARTSTPTSRS